MAYNKKLAEQAQKIISVLKELETVSAVPEEKKMFGGICWPVQGSMAGGIINDDLIVRVGPDNYKEALGRPHTRVFDVTGKVMKGWIMVSPNGWVTDAELEKWVRQGVTFALTLPPK